MHDDLQMMRQLELTKCIDDGQIPCRWVPDMGYGFGFPLFNFYPPLPYIVGTPFVYLGVAYTDITKILLIISFISSGTAMYFFAKEMFALKSEKLAKLAGAVSAIFYIWAPYHAVDVYVRGAMNEDWAMIFFPLILWTAYRLIKDNKGLGKWVVGLALSWVGLFLSHNLMVMIFSPIFAVWCLIFLIKEKRWKRILHFVISGLLILGLVAFFTLPAVLEQKYVQIGTLTSGYYEYIAHFVSISQLLISRFWGYGASIWGTGDGMPFPVGHFHWVSSIIVLGYLAYGIIKKRKIETLPLILVFLIAVGWLAVFMAHAKSTFIWMKIPQLAFVQFPWRFLTIPTFTFSFAAGALVLMLGKFKKFLWAATVLVVVGLVAWNWNFFKVERIGPVTDAEKFSGEAWRLQQTAGIYDYLPIDAEQAPQKQRTTLVDYMSGVGTTSDEKLGTDWVSFRVEGGPGTVRVNVFQFPIWKAYIDGKETNIYVADDEKWGRMYVDVPEGTHEVHLKLTNTPLRTISNYISLVTWVGLILFLLFRKKLFNGKLA